MTDIVKRLRDPERGGGSDAREAADEIERLRAKIKQLREVAYIWKDRAEATMKDVTGREGRE